MNGLNFVSKQCNYTEDRLAKALGVDVKAATEWLNGVGLTDDILKDLSALFGVDESFLREISEPQKDELLDKAMFLTCEDDELYTYTPLNERPQPVFFFTERKKITSNGHCNLLEEQLYCIAEKEFCFEEEVRAAKEEYKMLRETQNCTKFCKYM